MTYNDYLVDVMQFIVVVSALISVPVIVAGVIRLRQICRARARRRAYDAYREAIPKLSPSQRDFLHRTAAWRRMNGVDR